MKIDPPVTVKPFRRSLSEHGLSLVRNPASTLQINVGLLCNLKCRHCHLEAGPGRKEVMTAQTVNQVAQYARCAAFDVIDITGGAPEMNPELGNLIQAVAPAAPKIMLRSNLSALGSGKRSALMALLKAHHVVIVASFPSLSPSQADAQRGKGIYDTGIDVLKKLNTLGYGRPGSGLELNLVSNPTGAFLPPSQEQTEKRFREVLRKKTGIEFNSLFSFANAPLGRFREWLKESGNLDAYMKKLASAFNPCTLENVMCRTLVSVSWDGYLYDCDFNLAQGLFMGGRRTHVTEMEGKPAPGTSIATADHCYTCTAGSGFT